MKHLTLLTLLVFAAPFGWGENGQNVSSYSKVNAKTATTQIENPKTNAKNYFQLLRSLSLLTPSESTFLEQPQILTDAEAISYQPNDLDRFYWKALSEHCNQDPRDRKTGSIVPYMGKRSFYHTDYGQFHSKIG